MGYEIPSRKCPVGFLESLKALLLQNLFFITGFRDNSVTMATTDVSIAGRPKTGSKRKEKTGFDALPCEYHNNPKLLDR